MRRLLFFIAQRVGTPVYVLEREMPAHEFMDWILFLKAEQDAHAPPGVDDMGAEGLAMSLGAEVPTNGS